MATSYDVAQEAGVSQPTVSRALRGDPRISDDTRVRVLEAALRLSYTPNALARSLTTNRTFTIGLVIENISNFFYSMVVDAVYDALAVRGYRMILLQERIDARVENDLASLLLGKAVDGAIFTGGTADLAPIEALTTKNLPVVLLNRYSDETQGDLVMADNAGGGERIAHHLVGLGHRRIGVIAGPTYATTSADRERGFNSVLRDAGLPLDPQLRREGPFSYRSGYELCLDLLGKTNPPSAIFCHTDMIAFGAMDAARELGLGVPQDLSVAGFDDTEMASWSTIGLTTVRQPVDGMAEAAVRMLVDRIEQSFTGPARTESFPTRLIERTSTARPPS